MIYCIHESNIEKLESKIKRLSKKVNITYNIINEEYHLDKTTNNYVRFINVEVEGKLEVNDWTVLAKIVNDEGVILIKYISTNYSDFIDIKDLKQDFHCDHCNKKFSRSSVYIIRNIVTNEIKYVGSSCLKNYTGIDIERYASYLELIEDLRLDEFASYKSPGLYLELKKYLNSVAKSLKAFGFVPKTNEESFNSNNTADNAYDIYLSKEPIDKVVDVEAFRKFCEEFKDKDSYSFNTYNICLKDYFDIKLRYLVCARYYNYVKYIENLDKPKKENEGEFIGNIGDKIEVEGKVNILTSFYNEYGSFSLYDIVTEDNNHFVWKTNSGKLTQDEVVRLKGTIKEHQIFNHINQNLITRCKKI